MARIKSFLVIVLTASRWTASRWTASRWTASCWTATHWTATHWTATHWTATHVAALCLAVWFSGVSTLGYSAESGAAPRSSGHWAYKRPLRPRLPEPRDRVWPRHPLDRFLLQAMEQRDLVHSPPADRVSLARRVALTLTQLPPAPEQLDEFLEDSGPDAQERLVDRLLASPHFGERMAQPWLDLAHYADTHGYHADTHREMWRWRDWVVDAFNRGVPYDEFLRDQLAGDLVPSTVPGDPLERLVATGFLRNHMIIFENGVVDEEYRVEYVMDRVTTLGTVALGQTLQCARCHDHKHDPFTQADFYRLFAYFNNVPERGIDGEHGNAIPFVDAPTWIQRGEIERLERDIANAAARMENWSSDVAGRQSDWESRVRPGGAAPPTDAWLHLTFDEAPGELPRNVAHADSSASPRSDATTRIPGRRGQAILLDGQSSVDVPPLAREATTLGWTCAATVFPTLHQPVALASRVREIPTRRGWILTLEQLRPTLRVVLDSPKPADKPQGHIVSRADATLSLRKWQQVAVVVEPVQGESRDVARVRWYIDGKPLAEMPLADEQLGGTIGDDPAINPSRVRDSLLTRAVLRVGRAGEDDGFRGAIDDFWCFDRPLEVAEVQTLGGVDPLADWLAISPTRRTPEQSRAIRERFLLERDPKYRSLHEQRRADLAALERLRRSLPTSMVMREMSPPRATHILARGRFDAPESPVDADVPRWLTPTVTGSLPDRAALAEWLFREDHPLTARVAVNRFWLLVFGRGIVSTPDDLGTHGAAPTHPELLDWLAVEFRGTASNPAGRWDVKRLMRSLVTSAAFRQSSNASAEQRSWDPENVWLARGPRSRLTAEAIRDQALAVSGLLDRRLGGPGVFPYQPPGLWEELAYDPTQFSAQTYRQSQGADLYRRSIYTFWKRASPPPALSLFDAPDRETCTALRFVSNTPQQALVLMNDPTYHDAARTLADRCLTHDGATHRSRQGPANDSRGRSTDGGRERIERLFRAVLARGPNTRELDQLARAYDAERESSDDESALRFLAHLILSLDETVTLP